MSLRVGSSFLCKIYDERITRIPQFPQITATANGSSPQAVLKATFTNYLDEHYILRKVRGMR